MSRHFSNLYDHKYLFQCLLQFALVVGLMKATGGAGFIIVVLMVLFALFTGRPEKLFVGLLLSVCMMIANPHLALKGAVFAFSQRGMMVLLGLVMASHVFGQRTHPAIRPFMFMMAYILVMCISSAQGWCPIISYLKLFLFTLIYFSYYGIANQVGTSSKVSSKRMRSIVLAVSIFFVFGSMALLPFPGLSQMKAEAILEAGGTLEGRVSLFQGMANHSQCLGPVISVTAIVLIGDLLFSIQKFDLLYVVLIACCPYLVFKTSSRTGMGALVAGIMFVTYLFVCSKGGKRGWKSKIINFLMLLSLLGGVAVLCSSQMKGKVARFVMKSSSDDSSPVTAERIISSRMGLAEKAWANFKESPLLGNGFQVGEDMKGLSIGSGLSFMSAPIEKGVWVFAVLEEGGAIGWCIFVFFLLSSILGAIKAKAYIGASCLFVVTLSNMGEFTFFSMSYSGGYTWAMVFVGLALDMRRMKDSREMQQAFRPYVGAYPVPTR